jgi:hypothetical protein
MQNYSPRCSPARMEQLPPTRAASVTDMGLLTHISVLIKDKELPSCISYTTDSVLLTRWSPTTETPLRSLLTPRRDKQLCIRASSATEICELTVTRSMTPTFPFPRSRSKQLMAEGEKE